MSLHICWADLILEFTIMIQLIAGMFLGDKSINIDITLYTIYLILMSSSFLAFPYSFLWALIISHTAYKSADDPEYNIEQSYPKFVKIITAFSVTITVILLSFILGYRIGFIIIYYLIGNRNNYSRLDYYIFHCNWHDHIQLYQNYEKFEKQRHSIFYSIKTALDLSRSFTDMFHTSI